MMIGRNGAISITILAWKCCALFPGLPRNLRERVRLAVLQSWIDDTGKSGNDATFTLAGFVGRIKTWAAFADEWTDVLGLKSPRPLEYFKSYEAYGLRNQFKGWTTTERDKRVAALARVVIKFLAIPSACGRSFSIPYGDYNEVLAASFNPTNKQFNKHRNPFALGFVNNMGILLDEAYRRPERESIHLLFDEGIDRKHVLEAEYKGFIAEVAKYRPDHYKLLNNKTAEFRNDKCNPPLQAADLLAWHTRLFLEATGRGETYEDKTWRLFMENIDIEHFSFTKDDLLDVRENALKLQTTRLEQIAKSPDPNAALQRFKLS